MLLENKVAVIYGASGPIGGAVARAREGARVFLAGRTRAKLDKVADEIRAHGGRADTSVVDALNEQMVDSYVNAVVEQAGSIDISFNLISYGDVQQPLLDISVEDFLQPITNAMQTHFLTTRAAARHMIRRGSGVILAFGGSGPHTLAGLEQAPLLKRTAQLSDVGDVAAFVASDQARTMTASTVNISCGALMDY